MGKVGKRQWRGVAARLVAVTLLAGAAGCARAVYHRVRPGETAYRIGKAYGVSVDELVAANHLSDPSHLEVGQRLRIPGAHRPVPVDVVTPSGVSVRRPPSDRTARRPPPLAWPVRGGAIASGFGPRGGSFHEGIDIRAPIGAPVRAAADGQVLYSDDLRGYGKVIILRHAGGLATVYAHNQENRVREGQRVQRGEIIATVGDSGRTDGANLHFEVREDNVARDPVYFLPPLDQAAAPPMPLRGG